MARHAVAAAGGDGQQPFSADELARGPPSGPVQAPPSNELFDKGIAVLTKQMQGLQSENSEIMARLDESLRNINDIEAAVLSSDDPFAPNGSTPGRTTVSSSSSSLALMSSAKARRFASSSSSSSSSSDVARSLEATLENLDRKRRFPDDVNSGRGGGGGGAAGAGLGSARKARDLVGGTSAAVEPFAAVTADGTRHMDEDAEEHYGRLLEKLRQLQTQQGGQTATVAALEARGGEIAEALREVEMALLRVEADMAKIQQRSAVDAMGRTNEDVVAHENEVAQLRGQLEERGKVVRDLASKLSSAHAALKDQIQQNTRRTTDLQQQVDKAESRNGALEKKLLHLVHVTHDLETKGGVAGSAAAGSAAAGSAGGRRRRVRSLWRW